MTCIIDETLGKFIKDDFVLGDRKPEDEAISRLILSINDKIKYRSNLKNLSDNDTFARAKDVLSHLEIHHQIEIIYNYYYDIGLIEQDSLMSLINDKDSKKWLMKNIFYLIASLLLLIVIVSLVYGAFSGSLDPNGLLGPIVRWITEAMKILMGDL